MIIAPGIRVIIVYPCLCRYKAVKHRALVEILGLQTYKTILHKIPIAEGKGGIVNKYLEEVAKGIDTISAELSLNKTPKIVKSKGDFVMAALYTAEVEENTIMSVSSDYKIYVNERKLKRIQDKISKDIGIDVKYEVTASIMRHELRHVWQHQTGFSVGLVIGDEFVERDADKWMVKASKSNKERAVAEYIKALHESKDTSKQAINVIKAYRPMYGMLHSIFA